MSVEAAPRPKNEKKENWSQYINELGRLTEEGEADKVEELLLKPHPLLPGEKEAFELIEDKLDHPPRVHLDETGLHVVPNEDETPLI